MTSAATYFICKVPAHFLENERDPFSAFFGTASYILYVGLIYVFCLFGIWSLVVVSLLENQKREISKVGSTLKVTVISLIVSVALLLAAIFLVPVLFPDF